ncbi:hypothetical protein [Hymenobacter sp. BT730]|uniref:hypothetical protein n=1 Tax=Hymenobacter sp. BT730 TaxID=3063332 RepID=UPI0026E0E645|nr:hypothetical protein [Hymenobacter sp. BT730]
MNLPPTLLLSGPRRDGPNMRTDITTRFHHFHAHYLHEKGRDALLQAYCHAISQWVLNPNTDVYHIEMLFDEISLAVQTDELSD